jgi:hypothetical protein
MANTSNGQDDDNSQDSGSDNSTLSSESGSNEHKNPIISQLKQMEKKRSKKYQEVTDKMDAKKAFILQI